MSKPTLPNTSLNKRRSSKTATEKAFVKSVKIFYRKQGRHSLPWRQTTNPYLILVSEIMLQQTQVERVVPKYEYFIRQWPDVETLAHAPLSAVLKAWQGLGYNSRAKRLHECAKVVVKEYCGTFPTDYKKLLELPGIGPYTAGAIMAFAFNKPVALIETNVRTVYLHHFFQSTTNVSDGEILELVTTTLDTKNPRSWYAALMDYGSHLKRTHGNRNSQSAHYTKQSKFTGSNRQLRGQLIKQATVTPFTRQQAHAFLKQFDILRVDAQLEQLKVEGLLEHVKGKYQLPA